jgi:hypothetical protein
MEASDSTIDSSVERDTLLPREGTKAKGRKYHLKG